VEVIEFLFGRLPELDAKLRVDAVMAHIISYEGVVGLLVSGGEALNLLDDLLEHQGNLELTVTGVLHFLENLSNNVSERALLRR
jgi:hypothetical protein